MDTVISSKIKKLEENIKKDPEALDRFKDLLKDIGTPIIEEREGYNRFVWVTHVYISDTDHSNVIVYEDYMPFNYERAELLRVEGTDIWYSTTIVPYGQTVNYGFVINDSLDTDDDSRIQKVFVDALNKGPNVIIDGVELSQAIIPDRKSENK